MSELATYKIGVAIPENADLKLVEIGEDSKAPVHVLHHRDDDELFLEQVYVTRPVLYLGVRRL